jgi:protein arginine kinase activator
MIDDREGMATIRECPACSWTVEKLKSTGHLGCPECARSFRRDVEAIQRRAGRLSKYEGRVPARTNIQGMDGKMDALTLSRSLEAAILAEDFESAARIRDELRDVSTGRNH